MDYKVYLKLSQVTKFISAHSHMLKNNLGWRERDFRSKTKRLIGLQYSQPNHLTRSQCRWENRLSFNLGRALGPPFDAQPMRLFGGPRTAPTLTGDSTETRWGGSKTNRRSMILMELVGWCVPRMMALFSGHLDVKFWLSRAICAVCKHGDPLVWRFSCWIW